MCVCVREREKASERKGAHATGTCDATHQYCRGGDRHDGVCV